MKLVVIAAVCFFIAFVVSFVFGKWSMGDDE